MIIILFVMDVEVDCSSFYLHKSPPHHQIFVQVRDKNCSVAVCKSLHTHGFNVMFVQCVFLAD